MRTFLFLLLTPALTRAAEPSAYVLPGNLPPAELIALSTNLAASGRTGPLLIETPRAKAGIDRFLEAWQPRRVERPTSTDIPNWFAEPSAVVICPAEPRGRFLQAASLAATRRIPFLPNDELPAGWQPKEIIRIGQGKYADEAAVAQAQRRSLKKPVAAVVILANPADDRDKGPALSLLAPWLAGQKRAGLLLTKPDGSDASALLDAAAGDDALKSADAALILATQKTIPTEKRPNPLAGKDEFIEMEPGTPADLNRPFTFATGRVFHDDLGLVSLQLARPHLWPVGPTPRRVLLASNPGGGLPLLETFSRNTAKEFANRGYETVAFFEDDVTRDKVQKGLPSADIFLWEGHHKTLVRDFDSVSWAEPLRPGLIFLQSCLALNEPEALPLLTRGAVAIVGSSTRTYSGSGGAFTLCFFDAQLYEERTLGQALRQSKNFLACYSQLKEKRLGDAAKLKGANVRSAWAFTLWGDPTLTLPKPAVPDSARAGVSVAVKANVITVTVPETAYEPVKRPPFQANMVPNARLAGLITKEEGEEDKKLVPFLFAEVALPKALGGLSPVLKGALPSSRYVFSWDARRKVGYLLAMPRPKDSELRFTVSWEEAGSKD